MKKMELIMRRNTLTVLKKSNVYFQLIKIKVLRLWVLESPVQTDTTLLDVTCCVRLHTAANKDGNNSQNCWSNIVRNCCILLNTTANKDATTHNIVGPTLFGIVASFWTPLPTRTQQLATLLVQHCWELLRPFARSLRPTYQKWKE